MNNNHTPTILAKMTLSAAYGIESTLRPILEEIFNAQGHETCSTFLCKQLQRTHLPHLFPNVHAAAPVLILCLPETMKNEFEALANSVLKIFNKVGDHLKMTTCLVLSGATGDFIFHAELFLSEIGVDGLPVILVCGDQVWMVVHPWDENCSTRAQYALMVAGINNHHIGLGSTLR